MLEKFKKFEIENQEKVRGGLIILNCYEIVDTVADIYDDIVDGYNSKKTKSSK